MSDARSHHGREQASELTVEDLVAMLRRQRWTMLWVAVLVVVAGAALTAHLRPQFESSGLLFRDGRLNQAEMLAMAMPVLGGSEAIEAEQRLLRSRELSLRVIDGLGLNAEIEGEAAYLRPRPFMWQWRLDRQVTIFDRGLHVREARTQNLLRPLLMTVRFEDAERFSIVTSAGEELSGRLGEAVAVGGASFTLGYRGGEAIEAGTVFQIKLSPALEELEAFQSRLHVAVPDANARFGGASLLAVRYRSESPYEAQAVVAAILERYLEMKHDWATSTSRSMLDFVKSQLAELEVELDEATDRLARFQEESGLLELEPQLEVELRRLVEAEVRLRESETRRKQLDRLMAQLDSDAPDASAFAHVDDPVILGKSEELAAINRQITAMSTQFRDTYGPLRQLHEQRAEVQRSLRETVTAYVARANELEADLARSVEEYQQRLARLPESARALTEFRRAKRVYEEWYLFLLEQQQQASAAEASTLSDIRVVDRPQLSLREEAPSLRMMGLATLAAAFAVAGFLAVMREMRTTWFRTADEAREQFRGPVFAVVPGLGRRLSRGSPQALRSRPQSPFQESIRHLRTNLIHSAGGRGGQTVLVTSAMPGAGKTTISCNLACVMARSERVNNVVLVDADLHRPSVHSVFGIDQSPGLSDYLNGNAAFEDILRTVDLEGCEGLRVIASGPVPPSPVELIETERMSELLKRLAGDFGFVLLDSPPYPAVTTALVLATQVDRLLSICRVGHTSRHLFHHHIEELAAVQRHIGMVVNLGHQESGDVYGYYHYGYGGKGAENGNGKANGRLAAGAPAERLSESRVD